ncbi:hypothetical protein IPM62_03120 [Candidatus Woesebacteria bacterium]|nr:MAG: hypothetical protein IPM62_03120 [Candidatus Woesebacteria bacterium]
MPKSNKKSNDDSSKPVAKFNTPSSMRIKNLNSNVKSQNFARIPVNVVRHKV